MIFYLLTTAGGGLVGGAFNTVSGAIGGVGHAAVLACMRPKRASLTASCREVFDGVVRDVRR